MADTHSARLEAIEVDAAGARVCALARAGSRPVVFVHGLSASSAYFADAGERAELAGRGVLALDLAGFGRTPAPAGFGFRMREQAAIVAATVEALGLSRVTLVGHSMGGTISVLAAERIAPRLEGLILAEGVLQHEPDLWSERIERTPPDAWARDFDELRRRPEIYARGCMLRRRPEALARIAPAIAQTTAGAMRASAIGLQAAIADPALYERFLALDRPRCYVFSDAHAGMPLHARLRGDGVPIRVVPRAGHLMMLDNPDAFYSIVGGNAT